MKTALDEWKAKVDTIINTEDPIKRATSQIVASSCLYAIFYLSVSFFTSTIYGSLFNFFILAEHFDSCFGPSDAWSHC